MLSCLGRDIVTSWHCFTGVHQELEEQVARIRKQKDTMEDDLTGKVSALRMKNKELTAELESTKTKRKDRSLDQLCKFSIF